MSFVLRALVVASLATFGCAPAERPPVMCGDSLVCRVAEAPEGSPPVTIVAYGTSLTADGAWLGAFGAEIQADFPGRFVTVNAAESARYSVWGLENLDARVLSHDPDIVFLEFAVNDAYLPFATDVPTSIANLELLADRILAARPDAIIVVLVTNYVIGPFAADRPQLDTYYDAWRGVARDRGFVLVDEEPVWRALHTADPAAFDALVPDGLHPTPTGHGVITASVVLDVFWDRPTDVDALVARAIDAAR